MEVRGKITTLSHLIYIQPKSMFLVVSEGDKHYNIVSRIKSQHLLWKNQLVLRQWIKINNLKEVSIYSENGKIRAFVTTEESKVVRVSKGIGSPEIVMKNMINYEGKITSDSFSSSGFYELDGSIILCLSYMKLVTNIPVVLNGDSIVLHNIHTVRVDKNKLLLFMCGQGYLVNKSDHPENKNLHPTKYTGKTEDFLQEFALENYCGVAFLFSLFQLSQELCVRLSGILPLEKITRASVKNDVKGLLARLVEHLSICQPLAPKSRFFSREFFDHDKSGCTPSSKDPYWEIDYWPTDVNQIESRCNQLDLWKTCRSESDRCNNSMIKSRYWQHDVANVNSQGDQISIPLLIGVLSFQNGHWEMRDKSGSIECVGPNLNYNQYGNELIFATKFVVHREIFNVEPMPQHRIYVSLDEIHRTWLMESEASPVSPLVATCNLDQCVNFLVLNKSMSQRISLKYPETCHVFGFLLLVSLLRPTCSTIQDGTKHSIGQFRKNAGEMDSPEQAPESCILLFDHSTVSYPCLIEGRVYQLHLPCEKLLSNAVVLTSMKDIAHSSLMKRIYRVPVRTAVSPVKYSLPKCQSYMRRDVLSVAECLSSGEFSQTVSLRGCIVNRMHTEPRYDSERAAKNFVIHHGTWLGIPGNKKVALKIGDSCASGRIGATIDVYFNLSQGQNYPCGLCAGTEVELTWLQLHKTQNTHRLYCTSTVLTYIRFLKMGHHLAGDENKVRMEVARDACIGRRYLSQLDDIRTHDIFNCLVTVRYIHKLAISCHCSGCQSIMTGGVCSYVGCRWSQGTQVNLKAWCTIEDGSSQALMFINDDCCRRWLKFPASVWKVLVEQVLPHQGEFLYVGSKTVHSNTSVAFRILSFYCDAAVHLRRPLHIMTRKFGNNEANTWTTAYYLKEHPSKRLFCLFVEEMDPTSCAIELSALGSTHKENAAETELM